MTRTWTWFTAILVAGFVGFSAVVASCDRAEYTTCHETLRKALETGPAGITASIRCGSNAR